MLRYHGATGGLEALVPFPLFYSGHGGAPDVEGVCDDGGLGWARDTKSEIGWDGI